MQEWSEHSNLCRLLIQHILPGSREMTMWPSSGTTQGWDSAVCIKPREGCTRQSCSTFCLSHWPFGHQQPFHSCHQPTWKMPSSQLLCQSRHKKRDTDRTLGDCPEEESCAQDAKHHDDVPFLICFQVKKWAWASFKQYQNKLVAVEPRQWAPQTSWHLGYVSFPPMVLVHWITASREQDLPARAKCRGLPRGHYATSC